MENLRGRTSGASIALDTPGIENQHADRSTRSSAAASTLSATPMAVLLK
jgi:hypothetical protein